MRCGLSSSILLLVACLACDTPKNATTSSSESGGESTGDGDGDGDGDADTETETGDEPLECDAGLTMCCPGGASECEDEFGEWGEHLQGCVDTSSNSFHCGGCNLQCPPDKLNVVSFLPTACVASVCEPTVGACLSLDTYPNCDLACAVTGQTCLPQGCDGHTMYLFSSQLPDLIDCNPDTGAPTSLAIACDASPPPEYFGVGSSVTCCCD